MQEISYLCNENRVRRFSRRNENENQNENEDEDGNKVENQNYD